MKWQQGPECRFPINGTWQSQNTVILTCLFLLIQFVAFTGYAAACVPTGKMTTDAPTIFVRNNVVAESIVSDVSVNTNGFSWSHIRGDSNDPGLYLMYTRGSDSLLLALPNGKEVLLRTPRMRPGVYRIEFRLMSGDAVIQARADCVAIK